ncbi:MAG: stage IV sporulation protein A [Christensenellales bacterium]
MDKFDLYQDIATRTDGDIYIGVVGPVRVGKSSFISRFMQTLVLPEIEDNHRKQRIIDELPQSADGKTIMTTQPKFVPEMGEKISLGDGDGASIRLVDCVGYPIKGAVGLDEMGKARMVTTPWSDEEMEFDKAATLGTKKVINDHSTIGVVVTTDGSISGIDRKDYVESEEKVVNDVKASGKPFVILLNCKNPNDSESKRLRDQLKEKYGCCVILKNVLEMNADDMAQLLEGVLQEFPVRLIEAQMPNWLQALPRNSEIINHIISKMTEISTQVSKMKDCDMLKNLFDEDEYLNGAQLNVDYGTGTCTLSLQPKDQLFYKVLSEQSGVDIADEFVLISYIKELAGAKSEFDRIKSALEDVDNYGYGIVMPGVEDMQLQPPEIVRRGSRYGVKLKAKAPALHIMKVDVDAEVNPIIGSEAQNEEILKTWLQDFGEDAMELWKTNMLGKTLDTLAKENIGSKLGNMPQDARDKLRRTVTKIVNEGKGGVVCILL